MRQFETVILAFLVGAFAWGDTSFSSSSGNVVFDSGMDGAHLLVVDAGGNVGLGVNSPQQKLQVAGNADILGGLSVNGVKVTGLVQRDFQVVTGNTTLGEYSTVFVDTSAGNVTVMLPAANVSMGVTYAVKKVSALNNLHIKTAGGNIDKAGVMMKFDAGSQGFADLISNGSQWLVIGKTGTGVNISDYINQYSLRFDGVNDYVDFGNVLGFEHTASFSFSQWVNMTSGQQGTLFSKMLNASVRGYNVGISPTTIEFFIGLNTGGDGARIHATGLTLHDGSWHHVVCTYDGTKVTSGMNIYLDGALFSPVQIVEDALIASILNTQTLKFGNLTGNLYDDKADDISIWNKKLNASEVSAIYNNGSPNDLTQHSASANLVGYWRMGDGDSGTTVLDHSVNNNHGTLMGGMTISGNTTTGVP